MSKSSGSLTGKRILLIEDDYLAAQVIVEFLEDAGAEVVGPFGWIDEAFAFVEKSHSELDAAVLDVNLHGQKSYPVADVLAENNVLFVFTTGYSAGTVDAGYLRFPRCEKPVNPQSFVAASGKL